MLVKNLTSISDIVVGVDFSKYSRIVLRQAQSLAKSLSAKNVTVKVHVVYVFEDLALAATPNLYMSAYRYVPPDSNEMVKSVEKFYHIKESSDLLIVVRDGVVYKNILQIAKSLKNPLIVVGSVGHGAFSRFLLGSQAEKIALKSPHPVWVHRGSKIRSFKKVLIPIDFSPVTQQTINLLKNSLPKLKLNLDCLYIHRETIYPFLDYETYILFQKEMKRETNNKQQKLKIRFQKLNPTLKLRFKTGDTAEEIVRVGKKCDVVVMSPHNKSGLFRTFGKTTSKVIRLANSPVLIV